MQHQKTIFFQNDFNSEDEADPNYLSSANEVDWRNKGAINPVQNEGNCKSSWALALASIIFKLFIIVPVCKQF